MSNLSDIRQMARGHSQRIERSQKLLLKMGCNPDAVKEVCDSRQSFLHAIQTTEPPPELKKLLEESEDEDRNTPRG